MRIILSAGLWAASGLAFAASSPWRLAEPLSSERAHAFNPAAIASVRVDTQPQAFAVDSDALSFTLPDGSSVSAKRVGGEYRGATNYTWVGHVDDDPDQQVAVTRVGNGIAALLSLHSGTYSVGPSVHGSLLIKVDSSLFPACGGTLPPLPTPSPMAEPTASASTPSASAVSGGDSPDLIDVLIIYSPDAAAQIGNAAQRQLDAQATVDVANLAFQNSQMLARFRLAGVELTTQPDAGPSADLSWLSTSSQVAAWRNAAGADLVGLISEFSGSCGLGFVMSNPGPGFANSAFQVTARVCARNNHSYVHEHGHNMGLQHNPEDGGTAAAFPYAFGHYVNGNYRTVMSYSTQCSSGCGRVPYFSNPNVTFNGVATGIDDQRDNARAGNQTASIVAQFRAPWHFGNGFE